MAFNKISTLFFFAFVCFIGLSVQFQNDDGDIVETEVFKFKQWNRLGAHQGDLILNQNGDNFGREGFDGYNYSDNQSDDNNNSYDNNNDYGYDNNYGYDNSQ